MTDPEPVRAVAPALPRPQIMRQRWSDVGFVHWAVEPDAVARFMPPGVRPDVHEGRTYVGLVPFRMVGAGFAGGPAVPWAGTFLETNVRLYSVDHTGRRGIVFLSLDASRAVVVVGARAAFGLPYRWAAMRFSRAGDVRTYTALSRWPGVRATSRIRLRPRACVRDSALDHFLTARWGLHVEHLGRTWFVPNEHPTWPLRGADVLDLDDGATTEDCGDGDSGIPERRIDLPRNVLHRRYSADPQIRRALRQSAALMFIFSAVLRSVRAASSRASTRLRHPVAPARSERAGSADLSCAESARRTGGGPFLHWVPDHPDGCRLAGEYVPLAVRPGTPAGPRRTRRPR